MKPNTLSIPITSASLCLALAFFVNTVYSRDGFTVISFAVALVFAASAMLGLAIRYRRRCGGGTRREWSTRATSHPPGCVCRHCVYAVFFSRYAPP